MTQVTEACDGGHAATLLVARKLMPLLDREEGRTAPDDLQLQHYEECAIYQAARILDKIDERWPTEKSDAAAS